MNALRRKPTSETPGTAAEARHVTPNERFSPDAIGVISNYGDQYFNPNLVERIRRLGVSKIVYSGPIAILDEPMPLWKLIQSGDVIWVYGVPDRPRDAPDIPALPAGPPEVEVNGVLFRHLAPGSAEDERIRLGALQWPPPGKGREQAITAVAADVNHRLIVVGSGLEYERWVENPITGRWELFEQNVPGYADTAIARIDLSGPERQVIVHPTSRGDYFSVIAPQQNRMLLFTL